MYYITLCNGSIVFLNLTIVISVNRLVFTLLIDYSYTGLLHSIFAGRNK